MAIRLVRWAFERLYHEFAWAYDSIAAAVSWGYWARWILSVRPYIGHGSVLEIGCGTGYLQQALADDPSIERVIGLDRSWQMLTRARARIPAARITRADARRLPFASGRFDTVVATFPSDYIASAQTLGEAYRVLRPGGRLVIVPGAQLAGPPFYRRIVALAYRLVGLESPPHQAAPQTSADALLGRLRAAGFAADDRWVPVADGFVYLISAEVPHGAHTR